MNLFRTVRKYDYSVMLIASYLFLVPFGRLSAVPMAVMALLGIWLLLKKRSILRTPEIIFFSLLFAAFWIPVLASLPDAVNVEKTAKVCLVYLHYWLAGLFIIDCLRSDASRHNQLLRLGAFIISFWVADAMFQALFGYDVFGYKPRYGALNGLFGDDHPKMGIYLAALSPFLFVYALRNWPPFWKVLAILSTCSAIFLAGRRGGWIMLAIILICIVCWFVWTEKKIYKRTVAVIFSLILTVFVSSYFISQPFASRVDRSLLVFQGDLVSVDKAFSHRIPIWDVAYEIIKDHPMNGIGARGFRYAYRSYASADNRFIQSKDSLGAFYPHQIILDIGSGTGLIGLVGYLLACWLLICRWLRGNFNERQTILPYGLAVLSILFPLNTHYATYSSHWSALIFWTMALYSSVLIGSAQGPIQLRQLTCFSFNRKRFRREN